MSLLTPQFQVLLNGKDLTGINGIGAVISCRVTDELDSQADKVETSYIYNGFVPEAGTKLSVAFGYAQTGLTRMGDFVLDEPQVSGGKNGFIVQLTASSIDGGGPSKQERTQSYIESTVGEIVAEIAGRSGWSAEIDPAFKGRQIAQLHQTQESDLHFLRRLAQQIGAQFKVSDNRLLFVKKRLGANGLEADLKVLSVNWKGPKRREFGTVQAHWHDKQSGRRQTETASAGKGSGTKTLPQSFAGQSEAQAAAASAANDASAAGQEASLTLSGNPSLLAGNKISLSNPPIALLGGQWLIKSAVHAIKKSSGYTTALELERPQ